MFRFVHSSDLHVGRTFGQFPQDLAARLTEARYDAIERLGSLARDRAAPIIVLAGDSWDAEVPSDQVLRQSLDLMAGFADVCWVLLPGNHDLIGPGGLWERIAAASVPNVMTLTEDAPVEITEGLWILPAPCRSKDPGRDVTRWMDGAATPEGTIRLGIAHGSVRAFADNGGDSVIDPARADHAGLDYLALGDWHGWLAVGKRTLYPGTPEPDRFRDNAGTCAVVSIDGPGAMPGIERVASGRFSWVASAIDIALAGPPDPALGTLLPGAASLRDVLLSLELTGTATLADQADWLVALEALEPSLAHLSVVQTGLRTLVEADDLDLIDRHGALRDAAEALQAAATEETAAKADRDEARMALGLLYSWTRAADDGGGAP